MLFVTRFDRGALRMHLGGLACVLPVFLFSICRRYVPSKGVGGSDSAMNLMQTV